MPKLSAALYRDLSIYHRMRYSHQSDDWISRRKTAVVRLLKRSDENVVEAYAQEIGTFIDNNLVGIEALRRRVEPPTEDEYIALVKEYLARGVVWLPPSTTLKSISG